MDFSSRCLRRLAILVRSAVAGSHRLAAGFTVLIAALLVILPASAQTQDPCSSGETPNPTEVAVTAVPIVVASTTADYFNAISLSGR